MIAAIYARKSTDQSGVSDDARSVTRQVEHAQAYAARKGWSTSDEHVYVDDGISGAEFANRPAFMRLLNALKPRAPFQVLIMSEESRLGREQIETAYTLKQIVQAGVQVWFYLEDRERRLDSPTDKLFLSVTAFADEVEREKARQRVTDAMLRRARAGQVVGGACFGYDNKAVMVTGADGQPRRSHVERVINEAEAAVVRRIFSLYDDGTGPTRIAKLLNADHAPCPRSRQGRPAGWSPSRVHEVLRRELYRGVMVYNQTRKKNRWGQKDWADRPQSEWIVTPVPHLRVVDDELWGHVQRVLGQKRDAYVRSPRGLLLGRPRDLESDYLLSGFARCGICGAAVTVRNSTRGVYRSSAYTCISYHKRGRCVCSNRVGVPMESANAAVISALLEDVLQPDLVEAAIQRALDQLAPGARQAEVDRLTREVAAVRKVVCRLTSAIAEDEGALAPLVERLKAEQARKVELEARLATAQQPLWP